jgi:DNA-binding response OmpR family regulator
VDESHHRVLIVDDERTTADTLALVFSSGGYETQTAYTTEQAIEVVAEWLPDLAIIDVVLPQTNGIDLCDSSDGTMSRLSGSALLRQGGHG